MGKNAKHTKGKREEGTSLKTILIRILIGVSIIVISSIILSIMFDRSNGPPPPPVGELIVTASVDNPKPIHGSTVNVTVNVQDEKGKPVSGALLKAIAFFFKSDPPVLGETDDFGNAKFSFETSRALYGQEVTIKIIAEKDELIGITETSFFPSRKDEIELAEESYYIGNKNSKVFHRPWCSYLPDLKNRIYFKARDEAIDAGYRPCKKCNP